MTWLKWSRAHENTRFVNIKAEILSKLFDLPWLGNAAHAFECQLQVSNFNRLARSYYIQQHTK